MTLMRGPFLDPFLHCFFFGKRLGRCYIFPSRM